MAGVWTRNYYNMLTASVLGDTTTTSSNTPTDYDPPIRVRCLDGQYRSVALCESNSIDTDIVNSIFMTGKISSAGVPLWQSSNTQMSTGKCALVFGTGTTTPTYDDYKLENMTPAALTVSGSTSGVLTEASNYDPQTHEYSSKRSFAFTNSGSSPVTVSEFGIVVGVSKYNSIYYYTTLLYREVFDTPITLNPAENVVVTFSRSGEVYNYTPY